MVSSVAANYHFLTHVQEQLKVSEQCAKVTKTANKVLGIIKWSYEDKSMANLLSLYKALVI